MRAEEDRPEGDHPGEQAPRPPEASGDAARAAEGLAAAIAGTGPLLQRDYWAVLDGCPLTPAEVVRLVSEHFPRFAPEDVVRFSRERAAVPIAVGEELGVSIAGAGGCEVRAIHVDDQSFTLATMRGHPEAGRITFGAYRNEHGDVLFHIRSRARSSDGLRYVGFLGIGEAMQTRAWTAFVNRVAVAASRGVVGAIRAETCHCEDEPDEDAFCRPTYEARGD
jgi:hypothetical protein